MLHPTRNSKVVAQNAIANAENNAKPCEKTLIQQLCYFMLDEATHYVKFDLVGRKQQEQFELCEFMLNHKHTIRAILNDVAFGWVAYSGNDPYLEKRYQMIERGLNFWSSPNIVIISICPLAEPN